MPIRLSDRRCNWSHLGQPYERSGIVAPRQIEAASHRLHEGLELAWKHNDSNGVLEALIHLGGVSIAAQNSHGSVQILGFVEHEYESFFMPMEEGDRTEFLRYTAQTKAVLDESQFNALWQAGRAMSMEEAPRHGQEGIIWGKVRCSCCVDHAMNLPQTLAPPPTRYHPNGGTGSAPFR